jgi:hypothetical protein
MFFRRQIVKAILRAPVALAPLSARAQVLGTGLTVEIAERALLPGTTREAAEAWLRYWNVDFRFSPTLGYHSAWEGLPPPAGALGVLEGTDYASWDGVSGVLIEGYIYLDATDRVLTTRAHEIQEFR